MHIGRRVHIHEVLAEPPHAKINSDATLCNKNGPSAVSHNGKHNTSSHDTVSGVTPNEDKNKKYGKENV